MASVEKYELPEICYDEPQPGHPANPFPFIAVKKSGKVPVVLFIEIRQDTGETEPGDDGRPAQIVDCVMHKYVDLESLKDKLPPHLNDIVRVALGMKPLKEAQGSGQAILDKARLNAEKLREERAERAQNQTAKKIKENQ